MLNSKVKIDELVDLLSEAENVHYRFFNKRPISREELELATTIFEKLTGQHENYAIALLWWIRQRVDAKWPRSNNQASEDELEQVIESILLCPFVNQNMSVIADAMFTLQHFAPNIAAKTLSLLPHQIADSMSNIYSLLQYLIHISNSADETAVLNQLAPFFKPLVSEDEEDGQLKFIRQSKIGIDRYFHRLDELIRILIQRNPISIIDEMLKTLDSVAELQRVGIDECKPSQDGSMWWLSSLDKKRSNSLEDQRYPGALLIWIRDSLEQLNNINYEEWLKLVEKLSSGKWPHQLRLAMHALTVSPENTTALLNRFVPIWIERAMNGLYTDIYHELWRLIKKRSEELESNTIIGINETIKKGHKYSNLELKEERRKELNEHSELEMLVAFEPIIKKRHELEYLEDRLNQLRNKYGKERDWIDSQIVMDGFHQIIPTPTHSVDTLEKEWESKGVDGVMKILIGNPPQDWTFASGKEWWKKTDNSPSIRELIGKHPDYAAEILQNGNVKNIDTDYIIAILYSLVDTARNSSVCSRSSIYKTLDAVLKHANQSQEERRNSIFYTASMLAELLSMKAENTDDLKIVLSVLNLFILERNTAPEWNTSYQGVQSIDWAQYAINTVEGRAFEGFIKLAESIEDKIEHADIYKSVLTSIVVVLRSVIDKDAHPAFTTLIGMMIGPLWRQVDKNSELMDDIFRKCINHLCNTTDKRTFESFVQGYINYTGPNSAYWEYVKPLYERLIQDPSRDFRNQNLAGHFTYIWWNRDKFSGWEPVLDSLITSSHPRLNEIAIDLVWHLGGHSESWEAENVWNAQMKPFWEYINNKLTEHDSIRGAFISWGEYLIGKVSLEVAYPMLKSAIDNLSNESVRYSEPGLFIRTMAEYDNPKALNLGKASEIAMELIEKLAILIKNEKSMNPWKADNAHFAKKLVRYALEQNPDDAKLQNIKIRIDNGLHDLGYLNAYDE